MVAQWAVFGVFATGVLLFMGAAIWAWSSLEEVFKLRAKEGKISWGMMEFRMGTVKVLAAFGVMLMIVGAVIEAVLLLGW